MTDIFKEMHDLYMADKQGLRTMITIEQVIEFFEQDYYTGDNWEFVNNKEAAAVVRAQHEEIERLRAANKDALAWFEDLKVEFDKVRSERDAANAIIAEQEQVISSIGPITCRNGKIHERFSGCLYCDRDEAYERAAQTCDTEYIAPGLHFATCIRFLKSGEPK